MKFLFKSRVDSHKSELNVRTGVHVHISSTGRVWVDPAEVVNSPAFKLQLEAVRRLREEYERTTSLASA